MKEERLNPIINGRRQLLCVAASAALAGCATTEATRGGPEKESEEAEVTPGEDLMQEHGVLERILLIYDEATRRMEHSEPFELSVISGGAGIVRKFVEDYHEKLEEQFVFPRLQRAGRETELVAVLLRQHERGRQLTDEILVGAQSGATPELAQLLRSFCRMYRPHAAREETVLFPAFREVVGRAGYRELGEEFEEKEHQLFGESGFEDFVRQVADLERTLDLHDLARFTPAS